MNQKRWLELASAGIVALVAAAAAIEVLAAPSGWLNVDGNMRFAGGAGTVDWANSGPAGAPCANGGVNITGSGGIFNCGVPGSGGSPPSAPSLTPAAAADPTIVGAVFIVDPIAGDHVTGCPVGDPTTLSGGKNGDAISSYGWGTGPVPTKDDLSDVYAVAHTKADSHPEIYFGAERLVNNGDSHMDFEFLQSAVGLTGNCTTGGSFTGHRTEGDLLVAVDFTNGGALAGFSVWNWHCAAEPGPQPADGTVCDPTGVPHYQQILLTPFAALTVNAATIPCGGWVCRDQITGNSTQVAANDFLEGGVDLEGIPFTGCFHTFLPHTRTAQSFTSVLKDFAGPVSFPSCKQPATTSTSSPSGVAVPAGSTATDTVHVTNGGAGLAPAGTMTFFLCDPGQVAANGCVSGGTQVGAAKAIVAGAATSDPSAALQFNGTYCWRTAYAPDPSLAGIYEPSTHTNATTECFAVTGGVNLPNTGVPELPAEPALPAAGIVLVPAMLAALAWRRSRSIAVLLIAGLVVGASPTPPAPDHAAPSASHLDPLAVTFPPMSPPKVPSFHVREPGWRLVIPRIGVDAQIQPVGIDGSGAMAAPSSLDAVGWFNRGPAPGQAGDAVIDGHYGVSRPAVFRKLGLLRTGDEIDVVWPDGRTTAFKVAATQTVPAASHPPDLFATSGQARLSLITCSGAWIESQATYSQRLIVTAMLA